MDLTAEGARQAILMFEGTALAADEASGLAVLLGSTEEALAHMLLKRGSFERQPVLAALLAERAREWAGEARSARPADAHPRSPTLEERRALEAALAAAVAHAQAGVKRDTAVQEAWSAILEAPNAAAAGAAARDFDLHLRIAVSAGSGR